MKKERPSQWLRLCAATIGAFFPASAFACAACYGQSDSPLADGMNWGIFCLLAVVVGVLSGCAAFFIYHLRRAALTARQAPPAELPVASK